MKRLIASILLFAGFLCGAKAQNDAMFVYRNDGAINAFLKSDVDSMVCSQIDLDSLMHSDYVVQEIWTTDSIYRIPLAVIDSIGFVTPAPAYHEGVEQIGADLYGYVISYTDSTITFNPNIPTYLLPAEGQVVVSDKYEDPFVDGFSGRMTGMRQYPDSIVCMFETVCLDEVYSRLMLVGSVVSYSEDVSQSTGKNRVVWTGLDNKVPLPEKVSLTSSVFNAELERPSLKIDYFICINEENLKNHIMLRARFNSRGSMGLNVSKDVSWGTEPHWLLSFPIRVKVVRGCIDFGYFVQASGSIDAGVSFPFEVLYADGFQYFEGKGIVAEKKQRSFKWEEPEWQASINGTLYAGVASRLSVALLHTKVASLDLTGKFGPEVSSSYSISSAEGINTSLYENLKDVEVASSLKLELSPGYRVWFNDRKDFGGTNLSFRFLEKKVPLMPSISNLSWTRQTAKSGELNGNVQNDIFLPCKLGWAVYNNEEYLSTHFISDTYWRQDSWSNDGLLYHLSDIPAGGNCKAYPVVRLLNMLNVRVPESVDLNDMPVQITGFEVTNSEHKDGTFINDGRYYDYRFDVALTAEIESLDGVADWGYVYRDPYGKIKRISLMQYGNSYTDTRYAYYRNEAHSTACLYTYIKYEGDTEYYDGEPHDYPLDHEEKVFSCPDHHHPHAIDLGLPSGTKWACCNVGASSPEGYGGYYAWGETSEKSVYNEETYLYFTGQDTDGDGWIDENFKVINIGSDIAGTSYDVAHVRWGGSWIMPSHDRQMELMNNCAREWTTVNGVNGILVTGPSGGQIFLPAAGCRLDHLYYAGSDGYYWSSTQYPDDDLCAYNLYFNSGYWNCYDDYRNYGQSVRAVCP